MTTRDGFQSKIGFILAAAGAAIGLGNIWGFPTQAANNGGGAFVFVYLIVTVLLALPALYAEMYIGNQAQKNPVGALQDSCENVSRNLGKYAGLFGLLGAILMLSFYTIVAGWMLAHALSPTLELLELNEASKWLAESSHARNLAFTPIFIILGALIINKGVHKGIELWSSRLMPILFVLLIGLIIYILQQPGANEGVAMYLKPDFSQLKDPMLIISAMGQAFFLIIYWCRWNDGLWIIHEEKCRYGQVSYFYWRTRYTNCFLSWFAYYSYSICCTTYGVRGI